MAIRLKDIARDLGISTVTVSKVQLGNQDISEKTRTHTQANAGAGLQAQHAGSRPGKRTNLNDGSRVGSGNLRYAKYLRTPLTSVDSSQNCSAFASGDSLSN